MESAVSNSAAVLSGHKYQLQDRIQGEVITPADQDYDEARLAWNLSFEQRPAVIVRAGDIEDVAEAVRFARREGLGVAVQSTGHGIVRPADDCLLILTSNMREVLVDVESQSALVQAGAKWGDVLAMTQPLGLAPLLGSSPDVGVVGYTLGGGMGWLARKYGLSADSVQYFDVVTAQGNMIRVSQDENSDLFWGMRGSGGSLAIVTSMKIRLYPVSNVYGGNLFYPIGLAEQVFNRFRDWTAVTPNELTSSVVLMHYPPIPEVPDFLRGQSFVMVRGCFCGPVEEGKALLDYWRKWQEPVIDDFKTIPFSEVGTISSDPVDPVPGFSSGAWLNNMTSGTINTLIDYGAPSRRRPLFLMTEVRHAGGAIAQVDPGNNAVSHRTAPFSLQVVGMAESPEAYREIQAYTEELKRDLGPAIMGVYMNWLEGEESQRSIEAAYSHQKYLRLRDLKSVYDPENRFGFGFNILPAE